MRSLPLRTRLVLGYSLAMLIVLVATGSFVYWRVESALDRSIATTLSQATTVITPLVKHGEILDYKDADATGATWQLIGADGQVVQYGGHARPVAMDTTLTPGTRDLQGVSPDLSRVYRVRVSKVGSSYLAVATSISRRNEALRELLLQLVIAGLAALVITALVGERLAYFALKPVENYRRQAEAITQGATGVRLDVPPHRNDEVTRLGATLNQMLAALERAFEHERRFVNEASHELRTPLTLLKSRIQLTRRRARSIAAHEQVLAELEVDVAALVGLAEQLLEVGSADPEGVADLGAAVVAVAERNREARHEVRTDVSGEHPVPLAAVSLDRIVTNLVDNALIHGRPPVCLAVDDPPDAAGWTRLTVADSGDGISSTLLATATERFARAPEARSRRGAGLGLSLVENLVTNAGGELRLCAHGEHVSRGTAAPVACDHGDQMTVTVLLPAACGAPA